MKAITTNRLTIVPPTCSRESVEQHVAWLNDPVVTRFSEQRHFAHTVEDQLKYILSFTWPNIYSEIFYADKMIGTITARVDVPNEVADVGIMVGDKSCWSKGIGFEAWSGFCDFLLDTSIRKIEAGCMAPNVCMAAICHKYAMRQEAEIPDHSRYGTSCVSMLRFGRKRGEIQ